MYDTVTCCRLSDRYRAPSDVVPKPMATTGVPSARAEVVNEEGRARVALEEGASSRTTAQHGTQGAGTE